MLPFEPETLEALKARYPAAVADLIDFESVRLGAQAQPGRSRRHVFDFADGVRLIVSRELFPDGVRRLHLSASPNRGGPTWDRARAGDLGPLEFIALAERLFRAISGDDGPLPFAYLSAGQGVPHWFRDLEAPAHAV